MLASAAMWDNMGINNPLCFLLRYLQNHAAKDKIAKDKTNHCQDKNNAKTKR